MWDMVDVAIIGGGPGGSCCGSLIKKYRPDLKVTIIEREKFPRDHVGESLLPAVPRVLHEMGCWEKVEAADFPVKLGGTYRWGKTPGLWDFEFVPGSTYQETARPAPYSGVRALTAWQVDRAIYDKILLDHAAELGCEVLQETTVREVLRTGDRVDGLRLDTGEVIEAKHYVDASGASSILRKAMGVEADYPTKLRNIAIWDYFQDTSWAVHLGGTSTRILVMSVGYGWLWFIPIGANRTSVGVVIPLEYYKQSGKRPGEIFDESIAAEPTIAKLLEGSRREEGGVRTTNDWSYISERLTGENWFLVGDSCGFADPILSAGMTLAMMGARHVAYTIVEHHRGEHDPAWLNAHYNENQRGRIRQHIMFADFWYTSNGCFTDLIDYTREIARTAGHEMTADNAFRWLATGGFTHEDPSLPMIGACSVQAVRQINERFSQTKSTSQVSTNNLFSLDLEGVSEETFPILFEGRIWSKPAFRRGNKVLPRFGVFEIVIRALQAESEMSKLMPWLEAFFQRNPIYPTPATGIDMAMATMEAMIADGWIKASLDPDRPCFDFDVPAETAVIHGNRDISLVPA